MTNTPYIAFTFLEQLFSLINNQNEEIMIVYTLILLKKLLKIFLQ